MSSETNEVHVRNLLHRLNSLTAADGEWVQHTLRMAVIEQVPALLVDLSALRQALAGYANEDCWGICVPRQSPAYWQWIGSDESPWLVARAALHPPEEPAP